MKEAGYKILISTVVNYQKCKPKDDDIFISIGICQGSTHTLRLNQNLLSTNITNKSQQEQTSHDTKRSINMTLSINNL